MKKNLYKTTAIVTGLSIAERGLGFLYRVLLSRLIGAEGLGLYQVALSVFSVFLTVGTGGIPVTVSRLTTKYKAEENEKRERGIAAAGISAALLLTLPVALIFLFFGNGFTFLFADDRALSLFRILLVGLCLSAVYAAVRGCFWGNKQLILPSLIELIEEAVMVIVGVFLLRGVSNAFDGATRATVAVVVSYLVSFLTAVLCFFARGGKLGNPKTEFKPLFSAAMPVTAVRAGGSLINSAIAVLLPVMLIRAGATESEALRLFGIVSGMVIPVMFMPSTVIGSLALVLMPELSEDFYRKRTEALSKNIERGIFTTVLVACFLIPLLAVLGNTAGLLLYSNQTAGEMIGYCAPVLLPMSLSMITTSVLNSLNFEKQTLRFYFIGSALSILSIVLLPRAIGIYAYPVGLALSFLFTAVANLVFLHKKSPLSGRLFRRCALCAALVLPVSLVGKLLSALLFRSFSALPALLITAVVMLILQFLLLICVRLITVTPLRKTFLQKT